MSIDLPVIWAGIIALGVLSYVMLDGFDLGIGLIFPFFQEDRDRQVLMNTVAPIWDGNETWMVLGGAALYGVFPAVYATLLPATYMPIILMLSGLIFRGVAFELRAKSNRTRHLWDLAFICGSALATFAQGLVVGTLLQGIKSDGSRFTGNDFDWFSPFSVFCGMGLLVTYATLGAGWLIMKTEGSVREKVYEIMRPLTWVFLLVIAAVSLWTSLGQQRVAARWFGSHFWYFAPVPVLVLVCIGGMLRAVRNRQDNRPFWLAQGVVFLGLTGLVISIFPYIVPPSLDIWTAASPARSQLFALVGAAIVVPIIWIYTAWGYHVFRGKVRHDDPGYH